MNCLILEDEPLAQNILKEYISDVPGLKLKAVCDTAFEAMRTLQNEDIDVLFVDINLPKFNGIDFIKSLHKKYAVILTTAHHEFAIEAFNLNVIDYLLKPIEFVRFLKAVNKIMESPVVQSELLTPVSHERKYLFFNVDKKQVKVFLDEILYIESLKDYVRLHLTNRLLVTKFQIGAIKSLLNGDNFIRVHKSFIINKNAITSVSYNEVEISETKIPVGRVYKQEIEKLLNVEEGK
jgi:DNA-binding LytR/AlgR family response regulator